MLIAVAIFVMMGFVLYWGIYTTSIHAQKSLENRVMSTYQRMDQYIAYIQESTALLAKNDLMVNAFIDEEGRNKYLTPLVDNFIKGKNVISLSVVDFSGRAIFSTAKSLPQFNRSPELRTALSMGKSSTYLQKDNHNLIIIVPINYYGMPQGSVIAEFDLTKIVNRFAPSDTDAFIRLLKKGQAVYAFNYNPHQHYYSVIYRGDSASTLSHMDVKMEMGLQRSSYIAPLKDALIQLALIALLILTLGVLLAFTLSRKVTRPILLLTKRYKNLLDLASDGVFIMVPDTGKLIEYSTQTKKLLGYSDEEMRCLNILDWDKDIHSHEEFRNLIADISHEPTSFERTHTRKDGSTYIAAITATKFTVGEEELLYSAARDITEHKHMEEELRILNEELQQAVEGEVKKRLAQEQLLIQSNKMAEIGEMMGVIIHQWKQPLNAISLLAQSISMDNEESEHPDPEYEKNTQRIGEYVQFMSKTMSDFRNFFKPNQLRQPFNPEKSAHKIKEMFSNLFEKQNIRLTIHRSEHFQVMGNENEFMQVLINIFTNARDAILEQNRKDGRIDCRFETDDKTGIIRIRDNGGGISQELLPDKLFEPHVSTKGEKGTGIGLQICKSIIEARMNGKLRVENVQDGTEFIIELPVCEEAAPQDTASPPKAN